VNFISAFIEHFASDKYLSEQGYYDLFGELLPGCGFQKMGWAIGIVWNNNFK